MLNKLENIFRQARKKWGGNGSGSSPQKTDKLVADVSDLIKELEVKSVIDFGCGSLSWMIPVITTNPSLKYIGIDVVPEVTLENKKLDIPNTTFLSLADAMEKGIPACDLVISRDTFAHLSNDTGLKMLTGLKQSGSRYLLTSHYVGARNVSIQDGAFRPLNMRHTPYNFPEAKKVVAEGFEGKSMALWKFSAILPNVQVPSNVRAAGTIPPPVVENVVVTPVVEAPPVVETLPAAQPEVVTTSGSAPEETLPPPRRMSIVPPPVVPEPEGSETSSGGKSGESGGGGGVFGFLTPKKKKKKKAKSLEE